MRHFEIEILTKLRVLLDGTMIFELAVKNDTESSYFLLISKNIFVILSIIKNNTKIDVLKARTMIFEIRMKKSSRKIDSIPKMMHSGQIRHFRRYMHIKYYKVCIKWRKSCSTYRKLSKAFHNIFEHKQIENMKIIKSKKVQNKNFILFKLKRFENKSSK